MPALHRNSAGAPGLSAKGKGPQRKASQFRATTVPRPVPRCLPVVDLVADPRSLGVLSRNLTLGYDPLVGEYKRTWFEAQGVQGYLQCFRETDDGTMTLYLDVNRCAETGRRPLAVAQHVRQSLQLGAVRWVHTAAEQLFWQGVDPLNACALVEG